jgi:hypothetical protein
MVSQAFPSLNDNEPSWADIATTFTVSKGPLLAMSSIAGLKWGRKVDTGARRGASGGRVTARTTGEGSQTASASLYRSGMRQLLKGLMTQAPKRGDQLLIGLVAFDILIQHTPPGESEIYQVKIKGCRYLEDADDMKEGADPDKIDITLNPMEIVNIINGIEVVLI